MRCCSRRRARRCTKRWIERQAHSTRAHEDDDEESDGDSSEEESDDDLVGWSDEVDAQDSEYEEPAARPTFPSPGASFTCPLLPRLASRRPRQRRNAVPPPLLPRPLLPPRNPRNAAPNVPPDPARLGALRLLVVVPHLHARHPRYHRREPSPATQQRQRLAQLPLSPPPRLHRPPRRPRDEVLRLALHPHLGQLRGHGAPRRGAQPGGVPIVLHGVPAVFCARGRAKTPCDAEGHGACERDEEGIFEDVQRAVGGCADAGGVRLGAYSRGEQVEY
ncbi:hypothetical protein B0H13DRAFT_2677830 [Mycena leptocephala]|nr:hypothetical protein B0H13DRAFT_2677830 [Mycena leptocephala]